MKAKVNGRKIENKPAEIRPGNPNWRAGGPSPNPGGRPKGLLRFREELEASCGDDIIQVIKEALQDEDVRVRLDAVKFAVAYLYGRPGLLDGGNVPLSLERGQISSALLAEAQAILTGEVAPSDEGEGERADGSP